MRTRPLTRLRRTVGPQTSPTAMFSVLADTHAGLRVHLVPSRAAHLTRSRRREDQKLERELDGGVRTRRPHRCERPGDLTVRQRRHVLHDVALRAEHQPDPVARLSSRRFTAIARSSTAWRRCRTYLAATGFDRGRPGEGGSEHRRAP